MPTYPPPRRSLPVSNDHAGGFRQGSPWASSAPWPAVELSRAGPEENSWMLMRPAPPFEEATASIACSNKLMLAPSVLL